MNSLLKQLLSKVRQLKQTPNTKESATEDSTKHNTEFRIKESLDYLLSLRNKYQGQRGFVIGNGPSLKLEDLDRLNNEVTIASNKIFLAFPHVSWRPTVYTIADPLVWEKINSDLPAFCLIPIIPSYLPAKAVAHHTVRYLGNAADLYQADKGDFFSSNTCDGVYGGYSVTYENLQIAVHLGLDPIYLIGCDHYYQGEDDFERADQTISTSCTNNHFVPNYRSAGETVNPAPIEQMTTAYKIAARSAQKLNKQFMNATRGGHLEVFARCDFDNLFS